MKYDVGKNTCITVDDAERGYMKGNLDEIAPEMKALEEGGMYEPERYYDQGLTDQKAGKFHYGGFTGRPSGWAR